MREERGLIPVEMNLVFTTEVFGGQGEGLLPCVHCGAALSGPHQNSFTFPLHLCLDSFSVKNGCNQSWSMLVGLRFCQLSAMEVGAAALQGRTPTPSAVSGRIVPKS